MSSGHVLMLDCRDSSPVEGVFLLRLAGFQVTPVRDGQEMLNWFFSQQAGTEPFDLLLFDHCRSLREVEEVCRLLAERDVDVPLLLVRREMMPPALPVGRCQVCSPAEMIDRVSAMVRHRRVS